MGDPMMPSIYSVASELSSLGVLDEVANAFATKPSPGHESVTSGDSGFVMASPAHSVGDLALYDSIYDDIMKMKQDSVRDDLYDYLNGHGSDQKEFLGDTEVDDMEILEDQIICFDNIHCGRESDTQIDNAYMKSDLGEITNKVTKLEPTDGTFHTNTVKPRRSIRATRGGKTVVIASGVVQQCAGPTTRQRVARVTATTSNTPISKSPPRTSSVSSDVEVDFDISNDKSQNKNAQQARINRLKKKAYIQDLEGQVKKLTKENEMMRKSESRASKDLALLQEEVAYLKNVISNQSTLSGMLQCISDVDGVRFTTSFEASRKRTASELDHSYMSNSSTTAKRRKASDDVQMSGGICLHVDKDTVSVEFCSKCAKMAKGAIREDV